MREPPLDPPDYWLGDDCDESPIEAEGIDEIEPYCRTEWEIERDAARCENEREAQLERHYRRLEH